MLVLAFSFVVASLLSFRFSNFAVRLIYWLAAVWLGFLNFFFWASLLAWMFWFRCGWRFPRTMPLPHARLSPASFTGSRP